MKHGILLFVFLFAASCSKGPEAPKAADDKASSLKNPIGRGVIIDPRKAKPMLDRAKSAAATADAARQAQDSDLDAVK